MRKSTSIDSLTSSIQWASSTTKTTGVFRANDAAFTTAVNRRRRASGSIRGKTASGSADAQQIIKQQQVLRVGVTNPVAQSIPRGLPAKTINTEGRAQQPRDGMEGHLTGVRLAEGSEHLNTTLARHHRNLAHQTALPNTEAGPTTPTTAP